MRTEVVLQHGWAFDLRMWSRWKTELEKDPSITCLTGERGYFGAEPHSPRFSAEADLRVAVAHSLGLHLLASEVIEQCDVLILLASFLHFHPAEDIARKRSQRILRSMKNKLQVEPSAVIDEFWRSCYQPDVTCHGFIAPPELNLQRLADDLDLLDTVTMPASTLSSVPNLVSLYSATDRIVAPQSAAALSRELPAATSIMLELAGHAFPLTQMEMCLALFDKWNIRKLSETCHQ